MKAWTTATAPGVCAFDSAHRWKQGARVFRVQGATWIKHFCPVCAVRRQQAPPDTGEELDVTDSPQYPKPLKALTDRIASELAERHDGRARAARNDT